MVAGKTRHKLSKVKKLRERFTSLGVRLCSIAPQTYLDDTRASQNARDPIACAWLDSCKAAVRAKIELDSLINLLEKKAQAAGPPIGVPPGFANKDPAAKQ